ncbi:MAG: recombination regulator RecX [Clostridia bacterium]|nr:recombination regulator RecX [Clostridia bacterium]
MQKKQDKVLTYEQVKEKALYLLSFRPHSERELEKKLLKIGAKEQDIEDVIEFCKEYCLIDDEAFAKQLALQLSEKYGKSRIGYELARRGISRDIISVCLEEIEFDEEVLLLLVEKKLAGNFEKKSIDRAIRYFSSHGYAISDICRCIDTLKN